MIKFRALSVCVALLVGVAAVASPSTAPPEKTFTLRLQSEPATLDWNRAYTRVETYLLMNLMEGLLSFDMKLKPVPALAESWKISPDGKTYTFKIRPGVKWSDGVPLRAQDFVYSWKRLLSPVTAASYAYFLYDIEGAEDFNRGKLKDFNKVGIDAPDAQTFRVKLKKPVSHWISIPTFWVTFPMRQDIVEKYGTGWDTPGRMVTVGPYILTSHDIDSKIVLRTNPNYYGKRGNVEQVNGLVIKDDSTAMSLYEAGKLDFLGDLGTLDLQRLKGNPELKTFPYLKTGYLGMVVTRFPLSNRKLRRAIGMAIDRSKFDEILHGGQQAASSFVPPGVIGHDDKLGLKFDPIAARRELRESGIDLTHPVGLEIALPTGDRDLMLALYVQNQIKKNLGLEVTLQPFDHKTFRSHLELGTYPMFVNSWSADFPDADNFLSIFLSTAGNNRVSWKNSTFDEKVMEARYSQKTAERTKEYSEAQKILLEDEAAILPLYYEPNTALIRGRVHNLQLNPLNYLFLKEVTLTP